MSFFKARYFEVRHNKLIYGIGWGERIHDETKSVIIFLRVGDIFAFTVDQ